MFFVQCSLDVEFKMFIQKMVKTFKSTHSSLQINKTALQLTCSNDSK